MGRLISLNLSYAPSKSPDQPEPMPFTKMSLDEWFSRYGATTGETLGIHKDASQRALLEAYQDWVYAAATMIANRMMSLKWSLALERKARGKVETQPVDDHPFYDLMEAPNPYQTYEELTKTIWLHRLLAGNAYWYVDTLNPLGVPRAIYPIRPDQMVIIYDERTWEKRFVWIGIGTAQGFLQNEIVHFRGANPSNFFTGLGVVKPMAAATDINNYNMVYQRNFYANSARPDYVLAYPENIKLTRDTLKLIREAVLSRHQGVDKAHLPAIFGDGAKPYFPPANNADGRALAISNMVRDKIFTAFGIPPGKVDQAANRANAEAADLTFCRECILPKTVEFKAELERFFLNKFYPQKGGVLRINFENPVESDRALQMAQEDHDLKHGIRSRNDIRADRGMPPLKDGAAGTYWVMSGVMPVDLAGMLGGGSPLETSPTGEPEPEKVAKAVPQIGKGVKDYKGLSRLNLWREAQAVQGAGEKIPDGLKAALWSHHLKGLDRREPGFRRALRGLFAAQKDRVVDAVKESFPQVKAATEGLDNAAARLKAARKKGLLDIATYFDREAEEKAAAAVGARHIVLGFAESMRDHLEDMTAGRPKRAKAAANPTDRVIRIIHGWASNRTRKYAADVTTTTADAIARVIAQSTADGDGVDETAAKISELFDGIADYRANAIARTELNGAANAGGIASYRESEVVEKKQWLSAMDERTRTLETGDYNHAIDQIVPVDEPFTETGEELDFPGDPSGDAGDVINCRCTLVPHLPDHFDVEAIDDLGAEVQAVIDTSIDEWLAEQFPEG